MDKPRRYASAIDVLPPDLLEAVQQHFTGLLWIPNNKLFYAERKALVLALSSEGIPAREIARLAGVSVRRVHQILQILKLEEKTSDNSGEAPVCNEVDEADSPGE